MTRATPKLTIPSPSMMHYRSGRAAIDPAIYPDIDEFWHDLAQVYAQQIAELAKLGCTYLQLDDISLAYLNDPAQREMVNQMGEDGEHAHIRHIRTLNEALAVQARRHVHLHASVPGQFPVVMGRFGRLRSRGRSPFRRTERGWLFPGVR